MFGRFEQVDTLAYYLLVIFNAGQQTTNFEQGYNHNLTKTHYMVSPVLPRNRENNRFVYKLVDYKNKNVKSN